MVDKNRDCSVNGSRSVDPSSTTCLILSSAILFDWAIFANFCFSTLGPLAVLPLFAAIRRAEHGKRLNRHSLELSQCAEHGSRLNGHALELRAFCNLKIYIYLKHVPGDFNDMGQLTKRPKNSHLICGHRRICMSSASRIKFIKN